MLVRSPVAPANRSVPPTNGLKQTSNVLVTETKTSAASEGSVAAQRRAASSCKAKEHGLELHQ